MEMMPGKMMGREKRKYRFRRPTMST